MPIEPIPEYEQKQCQHPEHNPPTHICIPHGHQLRHRCPACGKEEIVRPMDVTCSYGYDGRKPEQLLAKRQEGVSHG